MWDHCYRWLLLSQYPAIHLSNWVLLVIGEKVAYIRLSPKVLRELGVCVHAYYTVSVNYTYTLA